jgi:hypothetical protein
MDIFASFNAQVNDLLQNICRKVQLTKTQFKFAEERYHAVSDWLSRETSFLSKVKLNIFPQGSLRIGTTVRPINQEEFDLDLVCQMQINFKDYAPEYILSTVAKRLKEDETYKDMMTVENRCIRLSYSGDFHLDIVPACPANLSTSQGTGIVIPDKAKKIWRYTDPKGYAQWFEQQKALTIKLAEARNIEPLPLDFDNERKAPLQYCIQLMKRHRDVAFEKKDEEMVPKSIVINTLAAMAYKHEVSVNDSLTDILSDISNKIESAHPRIVIKNPVNSSEDITEAWDRNMAAYDSFCEWIFIFKEKWQKVNSSKDMDTIAALLQSMFGELVNTVIREQAERVAAARRLNKLGVSNGFSMLRFGDSTSSSAGFLGTTITHNTFFGD